MGKFQLNKNGEDPIKIYEDTFKVANSTVETHLGKLGKMPNPIARERLARDDEETYTGYWGQPKDTVPQTGNCPDCGHDVGQHSGANTGDNFCYGGGNCDCHRTFPWIKEAKANVYSKESYTPDTKLFWDKESGGIMSQDEWGVKFYELDLKYVGLAKDNGYDFNENGQLNESKASEWNSVEAIAKEAISEDEKDEMFQYLFDLQESGITNMFGAGPYVEREFPHLDKKEVRDVVLEWMSNYETIAKRMGIESKASEDPLGDPSDHDNVEKQAFLKKLKNTPNMEGAKWLFGLEESKASEHQTEADVQRAIDKAYRDYPKRPLPSWMDDKELEYFGYDKELVECDNCDGRGWHTQRDFGFNAPTFVRACEKCGGYAVLRAKDGIGSGWNF